MCIAKACVHNLRCWQICTFARKKSCRTTDSVDCASAGICARPKRGSMMVRPSQCQCQPFPYLVHLTSHLPEDQLKTGLCGWQVNAELLISGLDVYYNPDSWGHLLVHMNEHYSWPFMSIAMMFTKSMDWIKQTIDQITHWFCAMPSNQSKPKWPKKRKNKYIWENGRLTTVACTM